MEEDYRWDDGGMGMEMGTGMGTGTGTGMGGRWEVDRRRQHFRSYFITSVQYSQSVSTSVIYMDRTADLWNVSMQHVRQSQVEMRRRGRGLWGGL